MSIYKKHISVGAFLKKGEDYKDGDVVEIANEGKPVEGKFGTQDVFSIKLSDNREGNVNFNQTSVNCLIDGYGEDSINWIGKKAKVLSVMSNVQGKMTKVYYFLHPEAKLDEASGQFVIEGKTAEIPIVEDEVNVKDIPF